MNRTEFAARVAEVLTVEQVAQIERLHDELDAADGCAAHGEGISCCVVAITDSFEEAQPDIGSCPSPAHTTS